VYCALLVLIGDFSAIITKHWSLLLLLFFVTGIL